MDKRVEKILITREEIQKGIIKAGEWISEQYKNKELVLVGLLKGCLPFYGQLASYITVDCIFDTMLVTSSWKGDTRTHIQPKIKLDITENITNKHVLIVDEIVDSALTLKHVKDYLISKYNPASVETITLLDKPGGREINFNPTYSCFSVENKFLVGYGCDIDGKLRNLPYVGIYKQNNK